MWNDGILMVVLVAMILVIIYLLMVRSLDEDGWLTRKVWPYLRPLFKKKKAKVSKEHERGRRAAASEQEERISWQ